MISTNQRKDKSNPVQRRGGEDKEERKDGKGWQVGKLCLARREEDRIWYRAIILDILPDQDTYLVFFTDYPSEAVVGRGEMVESIHEIPHGEMVDGNVVEDLPIAN